MDIFKTECFLRVSATLLLVFAVFLVLFDSQTVNMVVAKKATYRDLNDLVVLMGVDAAAAGYGVLQLLLRSVIYFKHKGNLFASYQTLSWICFFLDQVTAYVVFATTAAASTASVLAITGSANFEWMELCDRYNKFCRQIGIAMFSGFVASFFLIVVSLISAFNLFRIYSPKGFFRLKSK